MKKLLLTLAAVVGMLGAGSGNAWADTVNTLVISAGSDFTLGCKDATVYGTNKNQYSGNTGTDAEGFSVAITGKTDKALASANSITIDGASYTSIKLSNGAENTIYLPSGVTVQSLKLYSYINYNVNDKGKWGRTSYWKSVNGTNYSAETADTLCCWIEKTTTSNKTTTYTTTNFDCREFTFSNGVTDSIKFTNTGEQPCFVIVLSYTKAAATAAGTPTATSPIFSFKEKGYTVSLTAKNDGETVKYTLNSGAETTYNGAITVTNGDKLTYWAEAEDLDKSEDGTLEVSGLTTYDSNKAYVAWAYQADYKGSSTVYSLSTDPLYAALSTEYNVVPVAAESKSVAYTTIAPDLASADVVVITEAMTGDATFSNGLADLIGNVPVICMKAFNYGASNKNTTRWKWGIPSNATQSITSIKPADGNYKLFEGTTVENGEINLFDNPATDNHIQTVVLSGASAPANTTTLATVGDAISFHTASKYVLLGLSCNDIEHANKNAQTIIKNAAKLLLAEGNDASAAATATDLGTASFTNMAYATFVSESAAIIPEGVTAYIGALNDDNTYLNLTEISGYIPANTPVLLEGTKGTPATLKSTIYTIADVEDNDLQGSTSDIAVPSGKDVYTLSIADDKVAFRKYTGSTLNAGKAYLALTAGASAPMIRFTGMDTDVPGNVTGINAVTIENNAQQVIYDLRGRHVLSLDRPGLYIVNGKKVAVQ
jgi:hypothetical protein